MALFGECLFVAPIARPMQSVLWSGLLRPHHAVEQAPNFRHGEGDGRDKPRECLRRQRHGGKKRRRCFLCRTAYWFAHQTCQSLFHEGVKPSANRASATSDQGGDSGNRPAVGGKQDHAGTRGDLSRDHVLPLPQQAPLSSSQRTDVQHAFIVPPFPPSLFLTCGWSTKRDDPPNFPGGLPRPHREEEAR